MKQIYYSNPDITTTTTTTSETLEYGETEINVADSSNFSANDFILIEEQGNEYNEILKISSVDSSIKITVTSGIKYPHVSGVTITKLNYDKYKIEKSTNGSDYTELVTEDLDYSNQHNRIEYYDDLGQDSYYYKIYYVNSQTTSEDLQDTLNNQDNFSWITAAKFKAMTTLNDSYSSYIEEALRSGVEAIKDDLFFTKILKTTEPDNEFELDIGNFVLADNDGNREINKNDLLIYEYNPDTNLKTYLSHKVVKVFIDNPKVVFKENVPTTGNILYIETPVAQVKYNNYKRSYEEINKLYAINYLLSDKSSSSVKNAVLNWTAGGTTVSREPNMVEDIIDKNNTRIRMLMKDLMLKTYIGRTRLRSKISSLNIRSRGGYSRGTIVTEGGNRYIY